MALSNVFDDLNANTEMILEKIKGSTCSKLSMEVCADEHSNCFINGFIRKAHCASLVGDNSDGGTVDI